jgi:hypothetical protein
MTADDEVAALEEEQKADEGNGADTPDANDPSGWDVPGAGPVVDEPSE